MRKLLLTSTILANGVAFSKARWSEYIVGAYITHICTQVIIFKRQLCLVAEQGSAYEDQHENKVSVARM